MSETVNEYRIVASTNREDLEKQVNELIDQGWRLQGGVSVAMYHDVVLLVQAMVS